MRMIRKLIRRVMRSIRGRGGGRGGRCLLACLGLVALFFSFLFIVWVSV